MNDFNLNECSILVTIFFYLSVKLCLQKIVVLKCLVHNRWGVLVFLCHISIYIFVFVILSTVQWCKSGTRTLLLILIGLTISELHPLNINIYQNRVLSNWHSENVMFLIIWLYHYKLERVLFLCHVYQSIMYNCIIPWLGMFCPQ